MIVVALIVTLVTLALLLWFTPLFWWDSLKTWWKKWNCSHPSTMIVEHDFFFVCAVCRDCGAHLTPTNADLMNREPA